MRYSNIHTHTSYSDGKGSIRENVESAISKNMLSLGISDHSYTECDTSYCMKLSDYDKYINEVNSIKEEYMDKIPVFLGIEKDYFSEIDTDAFDYVIGSVHYITKNGEYYPIDCSERKQRECISDAFGNDVLDMAKCYYSMVAEHTMLAKPNVVGHFDVLNKFSIMPEHDDRYIRIATEAMTECVKYCSHFELNTGGIARGWRKTPYPNEYLLKHLLSIGGEVVISSDSHSPENLDFGFLGSVELLRKVGFEHFCVWCGSGFEKIKI